MKYDSDKSFGYPVLSEDSDDYVKSAFQPSFLFDLDDEDPSYFKLKYQFSTSVREIQELIGKGAAAYWIKISCRSTFYSKLYEVSENGEILIDGKKLRDTVEFSGYVIAKTSCSLKSKKVNPEFGYDEFPVSNGQVLALARPITYVTEKEFWKPISSIFEYRVDDNLKNGEFTIDIEDEYVHVFGGTHDGSISPDPLEVEAFEWVSLPELEADMERNPHSYTAWFLEYMRLHRPQIEAFLTPGNGAL